MQSLASDRSSMSTLHPHRQLSRQFQNVGRELAPVHRRPMLPGSSCLHPVLPPHHQVSELWDSFTGQLHQYDGHLAEQREQLQAVTLRQVDEFKGRLTGFASRCAAHADSCRFRVQHSSYLALRHVVSCC